MWHPHTVLLQYSPLKTPLRGKIYHEHTVAREPAAANDATRERASKATTIRATVTAERHKPTGRHR